MTSILQRLGASDGRTAGATERVSTVIRGWTAADDDAPQPADADETRASLNPVRSVARFARALTEGRVESPRARLGTVVRADNGQPFAIYRETVVRPRPGDRDDGAGDRVDDPGAVLSFRFHLWFVPASLVPVMGRLFEPLSLVTTPFFGGLPGFGTKLWLHDHATGDYQGVYQWESTEAATRYADALSRVMTLFATPGSVGYDVTPETSLESYLLARTATQ